MNCSSLTIKSINFNVSQISYEREAKKEPEMLDLGGIEESLVSRWTLQDKVQAVFSTANVHTGVL